MVKLIPDDDEEIRTKYTFKGKHYADMTAEDADEARYVRGDYLRRINDLKQTIANLEVEKTIKLNKQRKKKVEAEFNEWLAHIEIRIKAADEAIQEILDLHASYYMLQLETLKKERAVLKKEKAEELKKFDDANASMMTSLAEIKDALARYEEQADLAGRWARVIDRKLSIGEQEPDQNTNELRD